MYFYASRMNSIATARFSKLSLRVNETNENHHLWNNRGVWWCHLTIHQADATAKRLRFSLKTREIEKARERRDRIFQKLETLEIAVWFPMAFRWIIWRSDRHLFCSLGGSSIRRLKLEVLKIFLTRTSQMSLLYLICQLYSLDLRSSLLNQMSFVTRESVL